MSSFKPQKPEKELISIRINKELLHEVDSLSQKNEISRNEFIVQSIRFAIKNMEK